MTEMMVDGGADGQGPDEGRSGGAADPQADHRERIVRGWSLAPGSRVLELACGQGDATRALAEAVGPRGRVTAVDVAPDPGDGAPETVGGARARLLASPLGPRLDIRLGCDPLDPALDFPDDAFDEAVLVHGGWYFRDLCTLQQTLSRVRRWSPRLRVAEWDLQPRRFGQVPHHLAAVLQGLVEGGNPESEANVRTPFSRDGLLSLLAAAGWSVTEVLDLDTAGLQDAEWEIDNCLSSSLEERALSRLPAPIRAVAVAQGDVLRALSASVVPEPLPAYAVTAVRVVSASA